MLESMLDACKSEVVSRETNSCSPDREKGNRLFKILTQRFQNHIYSRLRLPCLYRRFWREMQRPYQPYKSRQKATFNSPSSSEKRISSTDAFRLCHEKGGKDRKNHLEGRRPLRPSLWTSSDNEQPTSPKQPFFKSRAEALETSNSLSPRKSHFSSSSPEANTKGDDVLFIKEFRNVKTKTPSPEITCRRSRKLNSRPCSEITEELFGFDKLIDVEEQSPIDFLNRGEMRNKPKEKPDMNGQHQSCSKNNLRHGSHSSSDKTGTSNQVVDTRKVVFKDSESNGSRLDSENEIENIDSSDEDNDDEDDDDIIVVANDNSSSAYIDYLSLKRIVSTIVTNWAEDSHETAQITPQHIANRLKSLYHQDFSHRAVEIEYCLKRAKHKYRSSRSLLQVVRPGLRKQDIQTLSPEEWLNDVIINHYMSILVSDKKSFDAISSFCYEELLRGKSITMPEGWQQMSAILIPICISSHWSLMSFTPHRMNLTLYNSMPLTQAEHECAETFLQYFKSLAGLDDQNLSDGKGEFLEVKDLPRQENEYDCGVYVCMFARCIVYGNSFSIMPGQVSEFRNWLKREIVLGQLLGSEDITSDNSDFENDAEESGIECLE